MENNTTNSNILSGLNNETQFFGNVPKNMEVAFTGVCLGAPIQYRQDKITGLTEVCLLVPTSKGLQPTLLTLGKEESLGASAYEATFHQLGVEKLINSNMSNEEACKYILEKFQEQFNLGKGNDYSSTVLGPKLEVLGENLKEPYPENYSPFITIKEDYMQMMNVFYSGKSVETAEKKTDSVAMVAPIAQTTTQPQINA